MGATPLRPSGAPLLRQAGIEYLWRPQHFSRATLPLAEGIIGCAPENSENSFQQNSPRFLV